MPTPDPAIRDHKAWLGYVQQEGLVVSLAALVDAQVVLDRNTLPMQERFLQEAALLLEDINRDATRHLTL